MHGLFLGALVAPLAVQDTIPDPAPTLDFRDGCFRLSAAKKSVELPLQSAPKKREEALIEKHDGKLVVWDRRGLTIRSGKRTYHTRFEDYPVSPKLLEPEAIRSNAVKFSDGEYKRSAIGVSGHCRVGDKLYMMPRWESRKGDPWLEALVEIDLAQDLPKPKLLGRFTGLSVGQGLIDSQLRASEEFLMAVTEQGSDWGVARYRPADGGLTFTDVGSNLVQHAWRGNRILYAEQSSYGMTVAGIYDLASETRRDAIETRGLLSFLPLEQDTALIRFKTTTYVRSMQTGAESRLGADTAFLPTEQGLLVFTPVANPKRATVYDPLTWKPILKWSLTAETSPSRRTASRTPTKPPARARTGR